MEIFLLSLRIIIGGYLIIIGIKAFLKKKAYASPEFEDEREYKGLGAQLLGLLWIILGSFLLLSDFFLHAFYG